MKENRAMQMPIAYMNAAGWAKKVEHAHLLSTVPLLTHVVLGSYTPEERLGNTGGTNFDVRHDGTAVNSLGLPNGGIPYLKRHGRKMVDTLNEADKKAVVSIAGFKPSDYHEVSLAAIEIGADILETNVGCPNAVEGGKHGPIASFVPELLYAIMAEMELLHHAHRTSWWLKVSPMSNPRDIEWIANMVKESSCSGLVATNTFPNISLYHNDGRPLLNVANNYGGMSGRGLKDIALSNCRRYRELLPGFIIIGVGGVDSGDDINDYVVRGGTNGVQVGAALFQNEDVRALNRIGGQYFDKYVEEPATA